MPAHVTLGHPSSSSPQQTPDKHDAMKPDTPKESPVAEEASSVTSSNPTPVGNDFVSVYQEYKERVYRYIYVLVKNDDMAQDITANAFLKLYKKWDELKRHKNLTGWLFLVAKNEVIDHYRSAHHKQTITFSELNLRQRDGEGHLIEEQLPDEEYTDMLEDVMKEEQIQMVQKLMHTLSLDDQTMLYLRYNEELPIAEIAVIYNKSEDAMKMYLHRLLKKMQGKVTEGASSDKDTEHEKT